MPFKNCWGGLKSVQWCEKRAKNKWVGRRERWSRELQAPEEEGISPWREPWC